MLGLTSIFLPQAALLPALTFAGLFWVFGLRKLAGSLIVVVLLGAASPMFDGLFEAMPGWFLTLFVVGVAIALVGRFLRDVLVHAVGELLARAIGAVLTSRIGLAALAGSVAGIWLFLH